MRSSTAPWRCLHCKQLRKHHASHCPTCQLPWQTAIDRTYVHGVKQYQSGQDYHHWGYHGGQAYYQEGQSPRGQKSPRKGQSPRGGKGKDAQGFGPFQHFPTVPFLPQTFPHGAPLPPPAGPPPPWIQPTSPSNVTPVAYAACTASTAAFPGTAFHPPGHACADLDPDCTDCTRSSSQGPAQLRSVDLPPDVQQRVQTESRKQGRRVIKDLQVSVKALGDACTVYEEALQARAQHISTWMTFLAEAVRNWTDYAKLFEQHEAALQSRITTARDQFQEAKQTYLMDRSYLRSYNLLIISRF